MTTLDLHNSVVHIKNASELEGRLILQLKHWKFEKAEDDMEFKISDGNTGILEKVYNFLQSKGAEFTTTEGVRQVLLEIEQSRKSLKDISKKCSRIKTDEYVQSEFDEHKGFLLNNIKVPLKDHQIRSSFHMYTAQNSANFSVPGSGKTAVVLSCFKRWEKENKVDRLLVVGPLSSFPEWERQYKTFLGEDPNANVFSGGTKHIRKSRYYDDMSLSKLFLISFHTLLNDIDDVLFLLSNTDTRYHIVVDEAHYMKQIGGNWARAILKLAPKATFRTVLTGTPAPKSYLDFFNIFDFLWPGYDLIPSSDRHRIEMLEKSKDFSQASERLNSLISPLFYRVNKNGLNLAKQVFHDPMLVEMNPVERQLYEAVYKKISSHPIDYYFDNEETIQRLKRGRMMRLRQALSNPSLLKTAIDGYDEEIVDDEISQLISDYEHHEAPAKVEKLLSFVKEMLSKKEKVVIWTNFIKTVELIENTLNKNGIRSRHITGSTPTVEGDSEEQDYLTREQIRLEFIDTKSGLDVLVANPAACAESISLHTTCSNAIYYDLSYNAAQYLQSLDRIHRVGGSEEKMSYYHYLENLDTVESEILKNLKTKANKMFSILDGKNISVPEAEQEDVYDEIFEK